MKSNEDVAARKLIDKVVPEPNWGRLQGLFATTYDLRPDFLEMDFLPSVFGLGTWDDRSWASRIALEKHLCEVEAATILAEARRYRGRPRSLRLEFLPAVGPRGAALHAKVTVLLFDKAVRLVVASANLTERGYRQNREVVAVLTASANARKESSTVKAAFTEMQTALAPWLSQDTRKFLDLCLDKVEPWVNGPADPDNAFVWTYGQKRLWSEFVARWPAAEVIRRISIVSPFWSADAGTTLTAFLAELKNVGPLAADAELRLLTDAFEDPDGRILPVLPAGYTSFDWGALGVTATAQPVSPKIYSEEVGGMDGFTGRRSLHAKVVLVEGSKTGLAYLGSANFTAHGWGFLDHKTHSNIEAGLIVRRSVRSEALDRLIPEPAGQPILLTSSNIHCLRPPENDAGEDPWPEFINRVLLAPAVGNEDKLALSIDVNPAIAPSSWSARLLDKDGSRGDTLIDVDATQDRSQSAFIRDLSPEVLNRLLTDQEILVSWPACIGGRPLPLNVESSARTRLPISPGNQRIQEGHLLSYYQGRIAWEDLFPDPDPPVGPPPYSSLPAPPDAGVDRSRIQSYQIREFVEALAGIRQDLKGATQSEPAMRLALLGPVSPFALAQTILEAVRSGRRTPTAAAFQMVELLKCLQTARELPVHDRLSECWVQHLQDATNKIAQLLKQVVAAHKDAFSANKAFLSYQKTVLGSDLKLDI
ncbi:MAG: hypothetical protein IT165_03820 [Bryobacterales bacterium]|nr:hypothetical protein [Bryobacterales bacterium]